ncbi:MAG: HAD family hydrolase [Bacteroidales bacterium]|nr:HAD family hydrolase [Bacteroidales bacterium]
MQAVDALIFDMDGTLWDAIDSYCAVWNATAAYLGCRRRVAYDNLLPLMGKPLDEIYDVLIGDAYADRNGFIGLLADNEQEMMPRLGGRLYPGVKETLTELHRRGLPLMMVSNCSQSGLDNFLDFTGLRRLICDYLTFGGTGCDKDVNLRRLVERYKLKRPVYVGDIQRDADSTHAAGMEFVWAAYGFGQVTDPDFKIDSFAQLLNVFDYGKQT